VHRAPRAQALAWLRCKVAAAAGALRRTGGAFAGMDDAGLAAYAAGLLGEWLAPPWQRRLAAACGAAEHGAPAPGPRPALAAASHLSGALGCASRCSLSSRGWPCKQPWDAFGLRGACPCLGCRLT